MAGAGGGVRDQEFFLASVAALALPSVPSIVTEIRVCPALRIRSMVLVRSYRAAG